VWSLRGRHPLIRPLDLRRVNHPAMMVTGTAEQPCARQQVLAFADRV
jgi:hypothetical protein